MKDRAKSRLISGEGRRDPLFFSCEAADRVKGPGAPTCRVTNSCASGSDLAAQGKFQAVCF